MKESTSWKIKILTLSGVAHARCQRQKRGMEDRRCEEPTMSKVVYCLRHGIRVLKKTGLVGALEGWKPRMDLLPLLPLLGIYELSLAIHRLLSQVLEARSRSSSRPRWLPKQHDSFVFGYERADFTADVGDIARPCLYVLAQARGTSSSKNTLVFNCSSHGLCIKCSSARSSSSVDQCR